MMSNTREKLSLKEVDLLFAEKMPCLQPVCSSKFALDTCVSRIPSVCCQLSSQYTSLVSQLPSNLQSLHPLDKCPKTFYLPLNHL